MCQVNTVLEVLYLKLIAYYMSNLSREELSIIFHKNPINMVIRYLYYSKAKENALDYICLFNIKEVFHLQKKN